MCCIILCYLGTINDIGWSANKRFWIAIRPQSAVAYRMPTSAWSVLKHLPMALILRCFWHFINEILPALDIGMVCASLLQIVGMAWNKCDRIGLKVQNYQCSVLSFFAYIIFEMVTSYYCFKDMLDKNLIYVKCSRLAWIIVIFWNIYETDKESVSRI